MTRFDREHNLFNTLNCMVRNRNFCVIIYIKKKINKNVCSSVLIKVMLVNLRKPIFRYMRVVKNGSSIILYVLETIS